MLDDVSYWALLVLPALFWAAYHYYKDRHRPEPIPLLIFTLALGFLSAYLGQFLYECLDVFGLRFDAFELAEHDTSALFLYCLLAIGPIEEFAKFFPFIVVLCYSPHFDEALDGVIYASFIGLGFAINENQLYLLFLDNGDAIARSVASPIVHILFASIWGYAYGYADTHGIHRALATSAGFVLAALLHGLYDFFVIAGDVWAHVVPPLIILLIWLARMHLTRRLND